MNRSTLFGALSGLKAYDDGALDSGIKDEDLRSRVKAYLEQLDRKAFYGLFTEYVAWHYFSESARKQGYGLEDLISFLTWMRDEMDISID